MEYKDLISKFLDKGYSTEFFIEMLPEKNALVIRHDVDFNIEYAYELSKIEDKLGVQSTYFFLINSKSYNLLETSNINMVLSIMSRGHQISLHFNPKAYNDVESGFKTEKRLFETVFNVKVKFVSVHRPSDYFLKSAESICGIPHSYHPDFFKRIEYFSDSHGKFRYGNPLESQAFRNNNSIQLLVHPIWWVTNGIDPISKLNNYFDLTISNLKQHVALNCIPYRKYLENKK